MRKEERVILVLGYCPLKKETIEKVIEGYLAPYGLYTLVEEQSLYWEVQVSHSVVTEIRLKEIEKYIIAELSKLTALSADLRLLGI